METYKLPSGANGATFSNGDYGLDVSTAVPSCLTFDTGGEWPCVLGRDEVLNLFRFIDSWLSRKSALSGAVVGGDA